MTDRGIAHGSDPSAFSMGLFFYFPGLMLAGFPHAHLQSVANIVEGSVVDLAREPDVLIRWQSHRDLPAFLFV